jgi:hypothetical protein
MFLSNSQEEQRNEDFGIMVEVRWALCGTQKPRAAGHFCVSSTCFWYQLSVSSFRDTLLYIPTRS